MPYCEKLTSEALRYGSHSVYTANTANLPSPRKRSSDGATTTDSDSCHQIVAYYSFIDPRRMKAWVGLVSWPTADVLPISCRSGAGQGKFAGQRQTFYHWATPLTSVVYKSHHQLPQFQCCWQCLQCDEKANKCRSPECGEGMVEVLFLFILARPRLHCNIV